MSYASATSAAIQGPRTFTSAVVICLTQYFQFSGRAPRSEYWFFVLFTLLVDVVAGIIDAATGSGLLYPICVLLLLIPSLAVLIRRLHDVDRSGWWCLILFVPLVGAILVLVWACTRGTPGPNRFGPDPLGGTPDWRAAAA